MNKVNHHKELEKIIQTLDHRPKLLLHSCCAPCSSYCVLYLLEHFDITCFYYNPNITDSSEYEKRLAELYRLASVMSEEHGAKITVLAGDYEPEKFLDAVAAGDLASCPERGERCTMCFRMRLSKAYEAASAGGFEYFTTTLTISPQKDAGLINSIGYDIAAGGDVMWLPSDFKKNGGYARSVELSEKYGLYRQNYCGCEFSKR